MFTKMSTITITTYRHDVYTSCFSCLTIYAIVATCNSRLPRLFLSGQLMFTQQFKKLSSVYQQKPMLPHHLCHFDFDDEFPPYKPYKYRIPRGILSVSIYFRFLFFDGMVFFERDQSVEASKASSMPEMLPT